MRYHQVRNLDRMGSILPPHGFYHQSAVLQFVELLYHERQEVYCVFEFRGSIGTRRMDPQGASAEESFEWRYIPRFACAI